ncbi:MAG: NTP transferase domain-containing protein, partial [Aeoliella sp.]
MKPTLGVVLAAGKGTRMQSDLPKVLVPVCGRPMIRYVVDALRAAGIERIVVVVGYQADKVRRELEGEPAVEFAEQREQFGTGHAVMMCRAQIASHHEEYRGGATLVVTGDSPMLQPLSIEALISDFNQTVPGCLLGTAHHDSPHGLGR